MNPLPPEHGKNGEEPRDPQVFTHSRSTVDISEDVWGDTTVRPTRPELRQPQAVRPLSDQKSVTVDISEDVWGDTTVRPTRPELRQPKPTQPEPPAGS